MIFIHKYSTGGTYMFNKIKEFFTGKHDVVAPGGVPYKVEPTPVAEPAPVAEVAITSVIEAKPKKAPAAKKAPAVKKPRTPKAV